MKQSPTTGADAASDAWPHSRACGITLHPHGRACHSNCPTCHGRPWHVNNVTSVSESEPAASIACIGCGGREDLMDVAFAPGMTYCKPCRERRRVSSESEPSPAASVEPLDEAFVYAVLAAVDITEEEAWEALRAVLPLVRDYAAKEYQRGIEYGDHSACTRIADRMGLRFAQADGRLSLPSGETS